MKRWISVFLCICIGVLLFSGNVQAISDEEIWAPSAVLMEAGSGKILYEKNAHEIRACASITKVMTLLLVMEAIDTGNISMDDMVSTSAYAASMGGSDIWLKEGEVMSVDDLIKATVIMSANDAAVALAEHVSGSVDDFVAQMNEKAAELGMKDTVFKNPNGLDEEGHVTSAYDVALMSQALIQHPKIFDYTLTWIDSVRNGETQLVNTNKLIRSYQGITGLKTGTTGEAGSCITATAERDGMSLIAVVLGSDTTDHRFQDAASLLDYGFANWAVTVPQAPSIEKVSVKGGMDKEVNVKVEEPGQVLIAKGTENNVESQIQLYEDIQAPLAENQVVGKVLYKIGDEVLSEGEIRTENSVEKISFGSVLQFLFQLLARI